MILLLCALLTQITHPPQRLGECQATLTVQVPERTDRTSPPRVLMELTLSGPVGLHAEEAKLGEDARSWKVTTQRSETGEGGTLRVKQTFELEQTRPGLQAVPSVSVRVRQPDGAIGEFKWSTPLGLLHVDLQPDLPGVEPPTHRWVWLLAGLTLATLVLVGLLLWLSLRRLSPVAPPTPVECARRELAALNSPVAWRTEPVRSATRLNAVLRTYLGHCLGENLSTHTVAECLQAAEQRGLSLPDLEAVLHWCDATRFAGMQAPTGEPLAIVTRAESLLDEISSRAEFTSAEIVSDGSQKAQEKPPT